jgi:hypothetical protein
MFWMPTTPFHSIGAAIGAAIGDAISANYIS